MKKKLAEEKNQNFQIETSHFSSDVVVSSSSTDIVKGFETYLQLMDILRPISFEVFKGITQIIDYYVDFIFFIKLFGLDLFNYFDILY